jgi:hypothetical protein
MTPTGVSDDGTAIEGDLRCPCGSGRLEFHSAGTCQLAPNQRMAFAVRAVCPACGQSHVLFDSGLHGWDALWHARTPAGPGHGKRPCSLPFAAGRCRNCGGAAHRGRVRLTVVPDDASFRRYAYGLGETQRIDAFTVITIDLECLRCGQPAPAWARYETEGHAFTNPYLPLSMELTVLWEGERIGRIVAHRRHRKYPSLAGTFIPDPGPAPLPGPIAELQHLVEVGRTTDSDEEWEAGQERYESVAEEVARRVRLAELPADLDRFALDGDQVHITAQDSMAKYARRHPPRCVRELSPELVTEPVAGLPPGVPDEDAAFRMRCPCGERACYVLGYFREDEGPRREMGFVSPLALECPRCGRVSELIDTRRHGHDGEQGCDCNMTGEGPRVRFPCPECGAAPLRVIACFNYGGHEYDPFDPEARPQDFFGWFTLRGECGRCGKLRLVTGFETA